MTLADHLIILPVAIPALAAPAALLVMAVGLVAVIGMARVEARRT